MLLFMCTARLKNSPARSKNNGDKSVVAMLKKGNWQERESVSDACHDRTGQPMKRSDNKLGQNSSKRRFSDARQLGCVFQDMTPPKSIYSPERHRHAEADPVCDVQKGNCASY